MAVFEVRSTVPTLREEIFAEINSSRFDFFLSLKKEGQNRRKMRVRVRGERVKMDKLSV